MGGEDILSRYFLPPNFAKLLATVHIEVGATPLPAALPLFATGIGGLGLLGWRRKRKVLA
jgi:hypothetical protein